MNDIYPQPDDIEATIKETGGSPSKSWLITFSAERLVEIIQRHLFENYAKAKRLKPTRGELRRCYEMMDITKPTKEEKEWVYIYILHEKVGRSLWNEHRGRVIISSLGFTVPIDAIKVFMKQQEGQETFAIFDDSLRGEFWRLAVDETMGDSIIEENEAADLFEW